MAQHSKSISEDCLFANFSTLQNGCFDLPESYTIYKEAPWLNTYLLCIGAARYFIVSTFPFLRSPKKFIVKSHHLVYRLAFATARASDGFGLGFNI